MSIPRSRPGDGAETVAFAPWHRAPMIAAVAYSSALVAVAVAILVWPLG